MKIWQSVQEIWCIQENVTPMPMVHLQDPGRKQYVSSASGAGNKNKIFLKTFAVLITQTEHLSQLTTNPTIRPVWPAKTQFSLYIHPLWQGFLFIQLWTACCCRRHMRSAKTVQTVRMHRLIRVFIHGTSVIVGFVLRWAIYSCLTGTSSKNVAL